MTLLETFGKKLAQKTSQFMKTLRLRVDQLVSSGRKNRSTYIWWKSSGVFAAMVLSDWLWASAVRSIAVHNDVAAANWSSIYAILSGLLVITLVDDWRLIVPYGLGAWIGTYLAV